MAIQAKCPKCKIHYTWSKGYPLWKGLDCPKCHGPLYQTTWQCQYKEAHDIPVAHSEGEKGK